MLLVGDIGGTKTDLAVIDPALGPRAPIAHNRFPSGSYATLEDIAREFLGGLGAPVKRAVFAVAGPVVDGHAVLTNLPWIVEESSLQAALGLDSVRLLNDVEGMAAAVPHLQPSDVLTLQPGEPSARGAIAVIAAGTGLGEAFLTWDNGRYHAHPSEGSHTNFGPTTPHETELLRFLQGRWGRVSYERVCGGRSIPDLYDFLKLEGHHVESGMVGAALAAADDRTPPIVAAALDSHAPDPLCQAALEMFVGNLGAEAGNLALTVLATGGVYLGGGMAERVLPAFGAELFVARFQDKGRLSPLLAHMPVKLIQTSVALLGAAASGLDSVPESAGSATA